MYRPPPTNPYAVDERVVALDRLIEENRIKDAKKLEKQEKNNEYGEWQKTPLCPWNIYWGIIASIFAIMFTVTFAGSSGDFIASLGGSFIITAIITCLTLIFQAKMDF